MLVEFNEMCKGAEESVAEEEAALSLMTWCCVPSPQSNIQEVPSIRRMSEEWLRVGFGWALEVPRNVMSRLSGISLREILTILASVKELMLKDVHCYTENYLKLSCILLSLNKYK